MYHFVSLKRIFRQKFYFTKISLFIIYLNETQIELYTEYKWHKRIHPKTYVLENMLNIMIGSELMRDKLLQCCVNFEHVLL